MRNRSRAPVRLRIFWVWVRSDGEATWTGGRSARPFANFACRLAWGEGEWRMRDEFCCCCCLGTAVGEV